MEPVSLSLDAPMPNPLPRRRVGRTAIEVCVLGLGGAPLGNLFEPIPEERALATVRGAFEAGVRYFDTAPQYGHGASEHRFGHILREVPRESFVLSTKVGRLLEPWRGPGSPPSVFKRTQAFSIRHDYGYDAVLRSLEASLHRLGLSRIDIALIHDVDVRHQGAEYDTRFREAVSGAVRALTDLKSQGVLGAIGLGVNEIEPCVRFAEAVELDAYMLAGRYTLLEQRGLGRLLELARLQGFSLVVAGPFNSGILATGAGPGATYDYRRADPKVSDHVARLAAACARHGTPLTAVALQFPLLQDRVAAVVTGAVWPEEIEENARLLAQPVSPDLWGELVSEGLVNADLLGAR